MVRARSNTPSGESWRHYTPVVYVRVANGRRLSFSVTCALFILRPVEKKEKVNYASTAPSRRCSFFLVVAQLFTERLQPGNAHLGVVTLILGLATTIYTINIKEMLHHIHNLTSFHSVGSVRADASSPLRGNSTLSRFTERTPNKMLRSIIETSSLSDTATNRHYHPLLFLSSAAPILRCGTLQH